MDLLMKILLLLHLLDQGCCHELIDLDVCLFDLSSQDVLDLLLVLLSEL